MVCSSRSFSGVFAALFLASTLGGGPVFADEFDFGGGGPPPTPTVNVTDTCTVVDTDATSHTYNQPALFLGICALAAAKEQSAVNAYTLQNFSFGLYLQSLNGTTPSATQFWDLYKNGVEASVGLSDLSIVTGDVLKFQLTDFTDNSQIGSPIIFQIGTLTATPVPAPASSSAVGGGVTLHAPFDIPLALSYLSGSQHADGSFDSLLLSDWAAIAFAGGGAGDAQKKLAAYFLANPPTLQSVSDYERHAMALEALGINPYSNSTSSDFISPIVRAFDGNQIGDPHLDNDDIFALFPLLHAGYTTNDAIIQKTVALILSAQNANDSWDASTDMTAAAIQALSLVRQLPNVPSAIATAAQYLNTQEQEDGGFGNSFSTSWARQAIVALTDSTLNWDKGYHTPQYYLATLQQTDGGVEPISTDAKTRAWATAYAVPAIEGKSWNSLLSSFEKPVEHAEPAQAATTSTAANATTSPVTATTSVAIATSTVVTTYTELDVPRKPPAKKLPVPIQATSSIATTSEAVSITSLSSIQKFARAQVAAAASVTSDPVEWLLAIILFILIAILAMLESRRRSRNRQQSERQTPEV